MQPGGANNTEKHIITVCFAIVGEPKRKTAYNYCGFSNSMGVLLRGLGVNMGGPFLKRKMGARGGSKSLGGGLLNIHAKGEPGGGV